MELLKVLEERLHMKTLIVEDESIERRLIASMISKYSEFDYAEDGEEAVQKFILAAEGKTPYDLVLLDVLLPKFDGQTVLEKIRTIEDTENHFEAIRTKVVMITSISKHDEVMKDCGKLFDGYVEKPVNPEILICQLREIGFQVEY